MATTKIWAVKGNLRSLVDYIENPEKTIAEEDMRNLLNVLSYAANSDKAGAFVTGVNCLPEIAIQQMALTKRQYGKTDGILAFHAYQSAPYPKPKDRHQKIIGTFRHTKVFTGFRALYFTYLYRMGVLPKNRLRPPCHPTLWEDVRKLRKYSAQIRLLAENKIDTSEQLQAFVNSTQPCMDDLIRERTLIQNKLRREKDPEVIEALKTEKAILTAHITPLRRNLSLAAEIEEQTERMKEKLGAIRQIELQEKSRQRRGRVR